MKNTYWEKLYWLMPAWTWGLLIFLLTSLPTLKPPPLGLRIDDKIYHFVVYAVLGLLIARTRIRGQSGHTGAGITRMLLYGAPLAVVDELHQAFIPGRFCDGLDLLADLLGLLLTALILAIAGDFLAAKDNSIYCIFKKYRIFNP